MSTETERLHTEHADLEQRLRRELCHVTVRMPADMVPRAQRAYRRRLVATRATAITGACAVTAVTATVLALTVPVLVRGSSGQPGAAASPAAPPHAPAASLRPQPPGNGLTARQAARDISWARTLSTVPGSAATVTDAFTHGGTTRAISYSASGIPMGDALATVSVANGSQTHTQTTVDYSSRTWTSSTSSGQAAGTSQQARCATARELGVGVLSVSVLAASAGWLLACPGLTVTRGTRIEGLKAITISTDVNHIPATLWLNAATDLPIQLTKGPYPRSQGGAFTTTQFGFLPPAGASLAYVSGFTIPAAFHRSASSLARAS